jgi:acyl carrier protein
MIDYKSEIRELIKESTSMSKAEIDAISDDANINELGIDSLELVEIVFLIEGKYNIEIDISDMDGLGVVHTEKAVLTIDLINRIINEKLNTV